jgi:hypothetical protein
MFNTNFLPIRDCKTPTGTDRIKNQRKATEGIN